MSVTGHVAHGLGLGLTSMRPGLSSDDAVQRLRNHVGLLPLGIGVNGVRDADLRNVQSKLFVYAEGA
jgi:vibriolysin